MPVLYPNYGYSNRRASRLFLGDVLKNFKTPVVEPVDRVEDAEYILFPHKRGGYPASEMREYEELSKRHGKPIVVFSYGDGAGDVDIENAIIIRSSRYKDSLRPNELIMPPYTEDLGRGGITIRKKGAKPTVGFCGWAGYNTIARHIKALVKDLKWEWRHLFDARDLRTRKSGILLRGRVLKALKGSSLIGTNFIIRRSYSRNKSTIELAPEEAREQFVDNLRESDFGLAVKGDGNFSVRFFEILSMGRLPVLIDTDCPLPLEGEIDYDDIMVRVPYREYGRAGEYVMNFWDRLTDEEYARKQKKARELYERYLRADSYLMRIFERGGAIDKAAEQLL